MERPLALRLAVVASRTILEERIVRAGTPVTIGRSPRALLAAAEDGWPRLHRLLEPVPGGWRLRLGAGMSARVADGGEPQPAADAVRLGDKARARIVVGDIVILAQVIRAPAPSPRPQLPRSVLRSPFAVADRTFAAIAALSLVLHAGFVAYLDGVDWPRKVDLETIPDRFVVLQIPRPPQPPTPAATSAPAAPPSPRRPSRPEPSPRPAPSASERRAILDQAARTGLVAVLAARSADGESFVRDLLTAGGADVDQEEALRGVGGLVVASADERLRGIRPSSGPGKIAAVTDLRGDPSIADAARVGPAAERRVAVVNPERPNVDLPPGATIDPGVIAREVKLRLSAVRSCYERALKRNPTLSGKLVLRFSITPSGTVSEVALEDDTLGDPELASCIASLVARWRFPSPGAAAVEVAFPFVFQSSS